jgi:hypothetical protein
LSMNRFWPNGVIPFEISPTLNINVRYNVYLVLQYLSDVTRSSGRQCLKFVDRSHRRRRNNTAAYIRFTENGFDCAPAASGYTGGEIKINIGQHCGTVASVGTQVVHALGEEEGDNSLDLREIALCGKVYSVVRWMGGVRKGPDHKAENRSTPLPFEIINKGPPICGAPETSLRTRVSSVTPPKGNSGSWAEEAKHRLQTAYRCRPPPPGCPSGWARLSNVRGCYRVYTSRSESYTETERICVEQGAHLLHVYSEQKATRIVRGVLHEYNPTVWRTGGHYYQTPPPSFQKTAEANHPVWWVFGDGFAPKTKPTAQHRWKPGHPVSTRPGVGLEVAKGGETWLVSIPHTPGYPFVCEISS